MRDRVFTGRSVSEALDIAGRTLGLAPDAIRYVVLERETAGVLGIGGTPARIAVLMENARGSRPGEVIKAPPQESRARESKPRDPRAAIRSFVREFAEASELDLTAEVSDDEQRTVVRVFGADKGFLLEDGGEVLMALDHVVQRAFGRDVHPRRLVLECEGFREARDASLQAMARELAQEVRADGQPRETEPLNGYERRIVHLTISEEPGVCTYSVGEGLDRRVTIAVKGPETGEGGGSEPA
jgi:spoIIIJ-associated protein